MPRPLSPAYDFPPVVSMPHTSAVGSVHYVDCDSCVHLIKARNACLECGDGAGARKVDNVLTDHRIKRHAMAAPGGH
ncbi:hypothetical protein ACH4UT_15665 [Streptomyces sp. NPDC020799]|uniref:hypothetical protein n=1 Tax=Streptomyces sp. NPDC020799 TaxID=3365091 RepID=UPI0037946299